MLSVIINQIYGLLIAVVLLVLYVTTKRLTLKGTSSFLLIIFIVIGCLTFDILSCIAIKNWYPADVILTKFICKTYLISMIWVGWANFCYICLDLNSSNKKHLRLCSLMALITLIMSIIVACVPIKVHEDPVYTKGPAVICTYIFTLFYIFSSISVAIYVLKSRNTRRGFAVLFSHLLWVLAAGIQVVRNDILLVGLAMGVGLLILYIIMENPDAHIDKTIECYSSSAFNEYLDYCLSKNKKIYILDVCVTSTSAMEGKGINIQKEVKHLIKSARKRKVHIFKTFNVGIAITSENKEETISAIQDLLKIIEKKNVSKNVLMLHFTDLSKINDTYQMIKLMTFARQQYAEKTGKLNEVSAKFVDEFLSFNEINNEILKALDEDRIEVFYQPIWNTKTHVFELAEALCRIRNKDGSLMSPAVFIPVSEASGSISLLGERVYRKVCSFCKENNVEEIGIKNVDVNLSAVQCDNVELANQFKKIAIDAGINPNLISFEITETAFSSVKSNMLSNMNELINNGFNFALDDFGKGASNLMYAIEMPVNIIKIDNELTKLFIENDKAKCVVNAIIKMAHDMNLKVVSEGVETEDAVKIISNAGIDYIQGYYFSKPLPEKDFIKFIKNK